jgi:DNA-binding transcriptional ArsR family regulator
MALRKSALRSSAKSRAGIVKAMAHPTRLLVMEALMDGELCVNDLTGFAECDVTTLSKHLAVMKKAGLLVCEKRGLQVFYRIACPCFVEFFRCIDLIAATRDKRLSCAC